MRIVPTSMTDSWHSQAKMGDQRPVVRAIIQKQNLRRFEYDTAFVQGGDADGRHRTGHFTSFIFGDNSPYIEIRNIQTVEWERSLGQDAATCTLTLMNSEMTAIGSPRDNPSSPDEFDKPGYFTFNRGEQTIGVNRWGYDTETGWNDVYIPDMVVKTYEGYGCDRTVSPPLDDNLVQSGTWMIDKVTYGSDGSITLEMRDLARLLLDSIVFPPAIPMYEYPLTWVSNHSENVPSRDASGGEFKDNLKRFGSASSSNDAYIGTSLTNEPYANYVGPSGGVDGHSASEVIMTHSTAEGPDDLFWRSTGQDARDDFVWWQFDANSPMPVAALRLAMHGGPYRVYISIHDGTQWLGQHKIHWSRNGDPDSPGDVDINAHIPFVKSVIGDRFHHFDVTLPRVYNAKKIRLTLTRLIESAVGEHPYRGGVREMQVYTAGSVGALSFVDGEVLTVLGNYGDYCADSETEILTRRGWLTWDQVQVGDETLAVNDEGRSEWTVIDSIFREHRKRKMLSMESQLHSSLTTPDHRWLTRDHKGRAEWRTTETLKHGHSIPLTATRVDHPQEAKYLDALVETVAWFWTEGWTHAQGGCVNAYISQSRKVNPAYCDRIEAALTALAGPASVKTGRTVSWSIKNRPDGVVTYRLGQDLTSAVVAAAPSKVVSPEFLTALTQAQLGLFIETSLDADGWRTEGVRRISQASEERTRAFEMACALVGEATSTVERDGVWYTTLLRSRFFRPALARREEVDYDGVIWCPTLKHGNWLARRNGKVYFTGNTHIVKWVCAWAGWYWPPHATGMDFIRVQEGFEAGPDKDWITFNNSDPVLPKGRVWGDFMKSGTTGIADLTVDMFDKKPLMDIINYVRDLLGFLFFIDEAGGVVWRMPNLGMAGSPRLGNYLSPEDILDTNGFRTPGKRGRFTRTSDIITIDEEDTLFGYQVLLDSANTRDRIFVANAVGGIGVVIKGYNPNPVGLKRVAGWSDQHFNTKREAKVMADMIAAQQMFAYRTGRVVTAGYPAIQVDDQIRIFERVTNETFYHYVVGIKSTLDMEEGDWSYELTTHWLGEEPSDAWAVRVEELSNVTQQYLEAIGYQPTDAEDNDGMTAVGVGGGGGGGTGGTGGTGSGGSGGTGGGGTTGSGGTGGTGGGGGSALLGQYSSGAFLYSTDKGAVDSAKTTAMRNFLNTFPDQVRDHPALPGVGSNKWGMAYRESTSSDPIWTFQTTGLGVIPAQVSWLRTEGIHIPLGFELSITGTTDSPMVIIDRETGVTVWASKVTKGTGNVILVGGSAGAFFHGSNGLDARRPESDDNRNFRSRGAIPDAMLIRKDLLDEAVATNGTLGHVLHCFWVASDSSGNPLFPMTGSEARDGWGREGQRISIDDSVDISARTGSPYAKAIARTLQVHGAYIGDNAGSIGTAFKLEQDRPGHDVWGGSIGIDELDGLITWNDFVAHVTPS